MKRLLLYIVLLTSTITKLNACNCKLDFTEFNLALLNMYNHIKICVPIEAKTINNEICYKAIVKKNYWGENSDTITVKTSTEFDQCRYPLELKSSYLLYGNGDAKQITINSCGFCRNLTVDSFNVYAVTDMIDYGFVNRGTMVKGLTVEGQLKKLKIIHSNEIKSLEKISKVDTDTISIFSSNKNLNSRASFKNGKLNGKAKFYLGDKTLHSSGTFTNNIKTGSWEEYELKYYNGTKYQIKKTGQYLNGEKTGIWTNKIMNKSVEEYKKFNPDFQETTDYGG